MQFMQNKLYPVYTARELTALKHIKLNSSSRSHTLGPVVLLMYNAVGVAKYVVSC